ncbi:protein NO VEIN isoform X3 [Oryzias melastigma]|uniref:protein NO VEIN isoform X3 n=1 Tax=Oryzias melastigma TaxID=30732 RepID=UPI00168D0977|nr:protein NO VEIN isoform X3 [Oryzias melastigma]
MEDSRRKDEVLKKTQECHRPAALKTLESVASRSSENPLGLVSGSSTSSCTPETQPFTGCKPKEQATQQPRILEEKKKNQPTVPSMDQLHSSSFGQLGEDFPLQQGKSLYDTLEPQQESAQPEAAAKAKDTPLRTASAKPKQQKELNKKQQAIEAASLNRPDTSAATNMATGEKSRAKEGNSLDAYYAQMREVHGRNMRASEARREPTCWRNNRAADPEAINRLAESVMRDIAAEGDLVTTERVISKMLSMIPSLDPHRLTPRILPALNNLQYLTREINMFIEATEAVSCICTLHELGQTLAALKDKKHYEELSLGPLCKLPVIYRMFKIDSNTKDDDIPKIRTVDILKQLYIFRKNKKEPKLDLAEFMKHLADHYNCEFPYELGIRISSFGLPISTVSKVTRSERTVLEQCREVIQKELEQETLEHLRKIKENVFRPLQSTGFFSTINMDVRKKYASMPAAEVVLTVLSNASRVFTPRMAKHFENFLIKVSDDQLTKALFQLAICGGSLAAPQDLVPKEKTPQKTEQSQAVDRDVTALPCEAKVKEFLKESLRSQNSAVTLAHIAALERKLTKHFHIKDFLSLERGTFLDFLVKNIQLLQESLGSLLFLENNKNLSGCGFRPSKQDVFEFIQQCGNVASSDPNELSCVESALRAHYSVRDSRDLGYGPLPTLAGLVQRQRELSARGLSLIYYESALVSKHKDESTESGSECVGRLGEVSKDQALASLLCCPLLEDLSDWSQWDYIFKSLHGPLKDFIERNAANTGLAALEVRPGLLLKITTDTGDKHFCSAVAALDSVGTAGHLVSMVVADGIRNAPTALLANHMQSALAEAMAKEDLSQAEEDISCYSRVATFLLDCLIRIPTRTCQALLQKVFLEPFSHVLGQAKSKQVLISTAQSDLRHLNCLHRLGILIGVTDWIRDYQNKLHPPQNHNMYKENMDQVKSSLADSSSSLSALNGSEDELVDEDITDSDLRPGSETEEEEDEEEMYELASNANEETSSSSEAEGENGEGLLNKTGEDAEERKAGVESESPLCFQKAILEDIRKSEFGIGVELSAEGQRLMEVQQERLGRGLDRLSTELYSKDTHFVLELIQNADDNSYSSDTTVPSLAFVVEQDCITVLNNESGFQEQNIRAICDVGRSTKGKHKHGYIGQKGIGFKSVFKVTDCPEIHSNGFHIRFDKSCGPMGYILPHWTEDERPLDPQLKLFNQHSWTTKIRLPLRSESRQTRNLFHDVHPSLLLFLHRLRSITIYNHSEKRLVTMTRKDLSHNVLEVEHSEGIERWLVVKTTLHPKKVKQDVESTELALAFQLGSGTAEDLRCQPQKQPVFAYLPLRSFGFRFIIQGDFDIPSSREDVDRDSSWNQWLRSEIPQLFLQAMKVFTDHSEFKGLKGLCRFLQFIPLPDEVLDFFKPVAGQIIQLLKGKAFLPTRDSDGGVVYKLPSQVAICQDAVIRNVISSEELEKHLSLSYLHPDLSPTPPTSLLTQLGVRYLRGSDVTTVTTAMTKELVKAGGLHKEQNIRQLARLLVCNFRAMEHGFGDAESILQNLKDLPIIPLADGSVVTLNGEGVFFPVEETKTKKKKAQGQTGAVSALYRDVSVVHPSLLSCLEPLQSQQVRELLKRLGVHELKPQELLDQHIYPTIKNNKWKSKPEAVVVSYLVFIKHHSASSQEYADMAVPVLTSRGLLCSATERVHFSKEYRNMDLHETLPGCDWTLVSPCYVETDGDVEGWRELLSRLGVRDGLILRKERRTLTAEELARSPWSAESASWDLSAAQDCVLEDYPCEEFGILATAQLPGSEQLQQRMALLQLLEANWDSGHLYSQFLTAQVIDSNGRPIRNTKSSFHHLLCSLEWIPAYQQQEGEQLEKTFLRPGSVYLSLPEVTSLLGTHVFYVDLNSSGFSRALGIRETISVEVLIQYLKDWCTKPLAQNQEQHPEQESEGASFTTTVQHIYNVYSYLQTHCPQSSLKELFQHSPAVFVETHRRNENWCFGRFYHLKEVCWSDTTTMFSRYRQLTQKQGSSVQEPKILALFYSQLEGMEKFFTRLLEVNSSPTIAQYVSLLEVICSSSPTPTAAVLQDVSVLFARLAQLCQDQENPHELNQGYCSTLKGMVSEKRLFPTKDNRWVSLVHKPMISDKKELEKIFKAEPSLCLLHLPPAEKKAVYKSKTGHKAAKDQAAEPAFSESDRLVFLEICGICRLSQCVKCEPQTEMLKPCPSLQALVRSVVPYIQKFLFHHDELSEVYLELSKRSIAEKIKSLSFAQVEKLYMVYRLNVAEKEVVETQDVVCLLKDEKELYIQKDHLSSKLEICRELVKLFCTDEGHKKELQQFLNTLVTLSGNSKELDRFLESEDVKELPADEEQWEVSEPFSAEVIPERGLLSLSSKSSLKDSYFIAQSDEERTLACWPPRAPMQKGGSHVGVADSHTVDAIMQMWPPPAPPQEKDLKKEAGPSSEFLPRSSSTVQPSDQPESEEAFSQSEPPHTAAVSPAEPPDPSTQSRTRAETRQEKPALIPPSAQSAPNPLGPPEPMVLSGTFQGMSGAAESETERPLLNLTFPLWNNAQPAQAVLEDMELSCQRPDTVVLSEDTKNLKVIGEWGEQLVNSFLCHWRDSHDPERPAHVLWSNQSGESGWPYDFKLSFGVSGEQEEVFVEVKSTVRKEKAYIQLSVNELDFALKKKECYQIFRVYSAGDAQSVRLCRIRNLAQQLQTKTLPLFLLV